MAVTGAMTAYPVHVPPRLSPMFQNRLTTAASRGTTTNVSAKLYGVRVSKPTMKASMVVTRETKMIR